MIYDPSVSRCAVLSFSLIIFKVFMYHYEQRLSFRCCMSRSFHVSYRAAFSFLCIIDYSFVYHQDLGHFLECAGRAFSYHTLLMYG